MSTSMALAPYTIAVAESVLDDLRERLARTRWMDDTEGLDWSCGTSREYLQELVAYWQHTYDWRAHEAELNRFAQFTADAAGTTIHFIHERSANRHATPLLLLHGWPDSFCRFHKVVPLLSDAFHLVVPSLPGFGFSERGAKSSGATSKIMHALMHDLGYTEYAVAGGDLGAPVAMALAVAHPHAVTALHLTEVNYPTGQENRSEMTPAERAYLTSIGKWLYMQGAYLMVHNTKPRSLAAGLNDSPAGLAAWFLSFIDIGAEHHDVERAFGGRDEILTNLTIYWATQTIGSSIQTYRENVKASYMPIGVKPTSKSHVPANIAVFPRTERFPREWAERTLNVVRFTTMPRGGHFAPLEEPELYANDVRESLWAPSR